MAADGGVIINANTTPITTATTVGMAMAIIMIIIGQINESPYVVPVIDEKGNVQYSLVQFNNPVQAKERVQNVGGARPGSRVKGDAVAAIIL